MRATRDGEPGIEIAQDRLVPELLGLARSLSSNSPLAERITALCRVTAALLGCDRSSVFVLEGGYYRAKYNAGNPPDIAQRFPMFKVRLRDPLVVRAMETKNFVIVNDAQHSPLMDARTARAARIQAIVVAPLMDELDDPLGFMTAEYNEQLGSFSPLMAMLVHGLAQLGALAITSDRREAQRHAAETRYRELVEGISDVIVTVDGEGVVTYVSPVVEYLGGYQTSEVVGRHFEEFVLPEDHARFAASFARAASGDPEPTEVRFRTKSGEVRWMRSHARPVSEEGRIVGLRGVLTDITHRKQMEQALEKERDRLQQYLDIAGVMLLALDAQGEITLINRTGCQILGFEDRELLGRNWFDLCLFPKDRSSVAGVFASLMAGEIAPAEQNENAVRTRSGDQRILSFWNTVLRDNEGRIVGTLSSGEDVTERKRNEEALARAFEEISHLKERLEAENVYLQDEIKATHGFEELVGENPSWRTVLRRVEQVAPTDSTVLLTGETGTGKELIARAVHARSLRSNHPLVKVNCAALPGTLIESELFGHEKGAFTGAMTRREGRFQLADGGTIFLDEIGDLERSLQAKLLRVLQEGEVERIGSSKPVQVDVRVIAATNRHLEKALAEGALRQDLYYRLNVFPISLPPLRDRREDIPLLVRHFIAAHEVRLGKRFDTVPKRVMEALVAGDWPGNVRQLQNVIEQAMILSPGPILEMRDSSFFTLPWSGSESSAQTLEEIERDHILRVVEQCGWRIEGKGKAADRLGLSPSTLRSRMKKLGIERR